MQVIQEFDIERVVREQRGEDGDGNPVFAKIVRLRPTAPPPAGPGAPSVGGNVQVTFFPEDEAPPVAEGMAFDVTIDLGGGGGA